jgi:hypothetical protein
MDIVNFSYLVANEIISPTIPDNALILFGNPDSTRDDGYKTWAIEFLNFKTELVTDLYSEFLGDNTTVTQITSNVTPVTINSASGRITTVALTTAAAGEFQFTVNNSFVTTTSVILVTVSYPSASTGYPLASISTVANGSFSVDIKNVSSAVLNAAATIHFLVIN